MVMTEESLEALLSEAPSRQRDRQATGMRLSRHHSEGFLLVVAGRRVLREIDGAAPHWIFIGVYAGDPADVPEFVRLPS
jgi:hypothetical protein